MNELRGRLGRILEDLAFRGGVQEIGVDAEGGFAALVLGDGDLVLLGEFQERLAALEPPLPPRCDDPDVRLQGVVGEFEPDLIVSLARGAVADGVGANHPRNLDLALGDQWTGDGRAEEILAFINRVGAEHREDEVADELLAQILDEDVLGFHAHEESLIAGGRELLALSEVGGERHDLALVGLLQPLQDDGRVQAAGIGEDDLLDGALSVHGGLPMRGGSWARLGTAEQGVNA